MAQRDPLDDGDHAWSELIGWARIQDGGGALAALNNIGQLRRLLDETEFAAVRAARQQGKSWAEIAVKLGVTRQSAWERWRDLDAEPADVPDDEDVAGAVLSGAARSARRRGTRRVPSVIGRLVADAVAVLTERGFVAVSADPDGTSIAELAARGAVVADQSPEAGARIAPGTAVRLWTERGGGAGVREPRRPTPPSRLGVKALKVEDGPHD